MARFGLTLAIAIVLIVSFQEASALKCWHCNSTVYASCGYPFEEKKLPKSLLIECPPMRGGQAACLKTVSPTNDKIIARFCVNNENESERLCLFNNVKGKVCDKCHKDECNSAAQYGPVAAIVAIPMAVMKMFSLF